MGVTLGPGMGVGQGVMVARRVGGGMGVMEGRGVMVRVTKDCPLPLPGMVEAAVGENCTHANMIVTARPAARLAIQISAVNLPKRLFFMPGRLSTAQGRNGPPMRAHSLDAHHIRVFLIFDLLV